MYISMPCPKCKKQVCIDLTITEKLTPATAESNPQIREYYAEHGITISERTLVRKIKELRGANNEQDTH